MPAEKPPTIHHSLFARQLKLRMEQTHTTPKMVAKATDGKLKEADLAAFLALSRPKLCDDSEQAVALIQTICAMESLTMTIDKKKNSLIPENYYTLPKQPYTGKSRATISGTNRSFNPQILPRESGMRILHSGKEIDQEIDQAIDHTRTRK